MQTAGGVEYIFFWKKKKDPGNFKFVTLPLEILEKAKLSPLAGNSAKMCYTLWKFQGQNSSPCLDFFWNSPFLVIIVLVFFKKIMKNSFVNLYISIQVWCVKNMNMKITCKLASQFRQFQKNQAFFQKHFSTTSKQYLASKNSILNWDMKLSFIKLLMKF